MTNRHIPVLLHETLEAFALPPPAKAGGTIIDCTLGGAGHTAALLHQYPAAKVLACDIDEGAIAAARDHLAREHAQGRVAFFHGNFSRLADVEATALPSGFGPPWSGVLLDLGYSSNQLEDPRYGMSFSVDAPLDMRLARPPSGTTAWELLLESSDQELGDILKAYGEMSGAHRLARRIRQAIENRELKNSTRDLAHLVEKWSGGRDRDAIHPATLVFQALRIAVNDELRALDHFLEGAILRLNTPGRLAVISFHSLEDRLVKRWGQKHADQVRAVTRKPVVANREEIKANPRARSAKLRVYERTA